MHKLKFKPGITRIKLNPEQAVLACDCWSYRQYAIATSRITNWFPYALGSGGYCLDKGRAQQCQAMKKRIGGRWDFGATQSIS